MAMQQKDLNDKDAEKILQEYTKLVDPVIKKLLTQGVSKQTRELVHYQINTGGKRLRPTLAILSCLACGGKLKDVLYAAAGLEILHTYTLIIDDIIDNSPKRRGKSTTWKKFGRSFAECIAVDYGATLIAVANQSPQPQKISTLLSQTLKAVMEGEMTDILLEQGSRQNQSYLTKNRIKNLSVPDYLQLVELKTASLFNASCVIGGLAANTSTQNLKALEQYGRNTGIAFQIMDDILDCYGKKTGKPVGQDIRERKLGNILILFSIETLKEKQRKFVLHVLKKEKVKEAEIKKVVELTKTAEVRARAFKLLEKYEISAQHNLNELPSSRWQSSLAALNTFICSRTH